VTNQPVGDVTPDVVALEGDQRLHVEIVVFHRLGEDKRDRLVQCGVPCIEIDLSAFQSQQASRERLEAALLRGEDNRRWVFHPEYEQALAKANEKLGQALETAQGKWNSEASRRSSPSVNMPKSLAAIPRAGALREAHGLMWRASLPTVASVEAAARDLAHSKHIPEGEVLQLTAAIQRRGDLAGTTPVELSAEWAGRLGVSVDDVARFLVGAGYAL
jgi:hypothetical protein